MFYVMSHEACGKSLRLPVDCTTVDAFPYFAGKVNSRLVLFGIVLPLQGGEIENFERWIYVLKNMETLQRLPFKARNAVFQKLEQIVDIAAMSKEDRMKYDESIKVYRDQLAVMEFERQKGMAEGMAKGMAEGIAKGAHNKQLEIARNLRQMGLSAESIVRVTGLDADVVATL